MVFNATFNNISIISWRSFLLVEKTGVPGKLVDEDFPKESSKERIHDIFGKNDNYFISQCKTCVNMDILFKMINHIPFINDV
jgi:hypothetical protein